jgi:hypothetical protein
MDSLQTRFTHDRRFTETNWNLVLAAGQRSEGNPNLALTWLCERYWFPLFAHVRGCGYNAQDAEDRVQSFFAWFLTQNIVERADVERGRFRSFLLGCLNNFLSHEWEKTLRLKRGGHLVLVPFDQNDAELRLQKELIDLRSPALEYDRAWALTLLDRVLGRLQGECEAGEQPGRFKVLRDFLQGERGELPLAQAAEQLALTLPALKSMVHRLRHRYREIIREEIRETVSTDEEVDRELQHLFAALGS